MHLATAAGALRHLHIHIDPLQTRLLIQMPKITNTLNPTAIVDIHKKILVVFMIWIIISKHHKNSIYFIILILISIILIILGIVIFR